VIYHFHRGILQRAEKRARSWRESSKKEKEGGGEGRGGGGGGYLAILGVGAVLTPQLWEVLLAGIAAKLPDAGVEVLVLVRLQVRLLGLKVEQVLLQDAA